MPGAVETGITAHSGVDILSRPSESQSGFPTTSPQKAANVILDGIEHERLHIYVGPDSRTMSLLNRTAPERFTI